MPEYLAPGVYIEEVSFRSKSIEGVSTSTAGFVGPALYGPVSGEPELITSFADYERVFGGLDQLTFNSAGETGPSHNYLAHGVRAFFEEGGKRLYVVRVYDPTGTGAGGGRASTAAEETTGRRFLLSARFPGSGGNLRVTFMPRLSDNLRVTVAGASQVRRIRPNDTVVVSSLASPPAGAVLFDVRREGDGVILAGVGGAADRTIASLGPDESVRLLTVDVSIERPVSRPARPTEQYGPPEVLDGFGVSPDHPQGLPRYFTQLPDSRLRSLTVPFVISEGQSGGPDVLRDLTVGTTADYTGAHLALGVLGMPLIERILMDDPDIALEDKQVVYVLQGGSDGARPTSNEYEGTQGTQPTGLRAFEAIEDISILAAPGYSYDYGSRTGDADSIQGLLISHCERMRYRIAVLDSGDGQALSEVRAQRAKVDSKHAAFYYPWVRVMDPVTEREIYLPPSGFVSGIYARNDIDHGVHKAPANEVVRLAIGFEAMLNKAQQDVLNPEGVNCFRFFSGRGYRLWGARTISSDPEWKYVNLRRYFAYLERSVERGTQWAVFENNSYPLWANIRRTVEDFLFNEWKSDRLMGETPKEAFFVRCDRTTMTQNDIDNGRLICLVGVAPVRPAEFVIFRIGQWTADRRG